MVSSAATTHTSAPPNAVWAVLADGYRYKDWVHGTKEIRDVDAGWPEVGTAIHFTVGMGPITYKDKTTSRACTPQRKLELEAYAWPAGSARVGLRIEPSGAGSTITMDEHPLRGPARWLHNPLSAVVFKVRVKAMLRDLKRLAEEEAAR